MGLSSICGAYAMTSDAYLLIYTADSSFRKPSPRSEFIQSRVSLRLIVQLLASPAVPSGAYCGNVLLPACGRW